MTNWILCPVRNNLYLTRVAVKTFLNQDIHNGGGIQILLIDNGSTDGTFHWARAQDPKKLTYWRPLTAWSVAESWNQGLHRILEEFNEEYALVVNNDVELRPDTYRHLVEDGGDFVTAVGVTEPEKIVPPYTPPDPNKKRPHPDFSCYLMRKSVWEKVGPFDENFKGAYAEDWDYHCRLHQAGITAECIDLPFLHYGAATANNEDSDGQLAIHTQARLNRDYFKQKWGMEGASKEYYDFFGGGEPVSPEEEAPSEPQQGQ
jgi:GT2 family glycosyltransferase